ncbi:trimeric intracellular cation channel family protein [Bradyrhizobium sp. USDA 4353]
MRSSHAWFVAIETLGIVSFAVNAMIVADAKRLSALGIFACAFAAAFGGGTLRDLLLGPAAQPFFWIVYPLEVVAVFAVAMLYAHVALVKRLIARRDRVIRESAEAIALASFAALGATKAYAILSLSIGPGVLATAQLFILCALMGAIGSGFGSIIRDVLINEVPATLRPRHWILEAAFLGAGVVAAMRLLEVPQAWAILAGFLATLLIRAIAILSVRGGHDRVTSVPDDAGVAAE